MLDPFALERLRAQRLIAVIRAPSPAAALAGARAVAGGGLSLLEVTFTVPDTLRVIAELARDEGLVIGAGTVLTGAEARAAIEAGARFIVAPNLDREVAKVALDSGVLYIPGAY